jgi:hypothetical protein
VRNFWVLGNFPVKLVRVLGNHFLKTYSPYKSQYLLKRNSCPSTNRQVRSLSLYYFRMYSSISKYLFSLGTCTAIKIFRHWTIASSRIDQRATAKPLASVQNSWWMTVWSQIVPVPVLSLIEIDEYLLYLLA